MKNLPQYLYAAIYLQQHYNAKYINCQVRFVSICKVYVILSFHNKQI